MSHHLVKSITYSYLSWSAYISSQVIDSNNKSGKLMLIFKQVIENTGCVCISRSNKNQRVTLRRELSDSN
jgi:hypothetical protein